MFSKNTPVRPGPAGGAENVEDLRLAINAEISDTDDGRLIRNNVVVVPLAIFSLLSGGAGYAAGSNLTAILNQIIVATGGNPLPEHLLTYTIGSPAVVNFAAFNYYAGEEFIKDVRETFPGLFGLKANANTYKMLQFIAFAVMGFASAIPGAIFTYQGNEKASTELGTALAIFNFIGSSFANTLGVSQALGGKSSGERKHKNLSIRLTISLVSLLAGATTMSGATIFPIMSVPELWQKIAVGVCSIPPTLLFSNAVYSTLNPIIDPKAISHNQNPSSATAKLKSIANNVCGGIFSTTSALCMAATTYQGLKFFCPDNHQDDVDDCDMTTRMLLILPALVTLATSSRLWFPPTKAAVKRIANSLSRCCAKPTRPETSPLLNPQIP